MLSIIRGIPLLCAIPATFSMSIISLLGFPKLSINIAFVLGLIAFSKFIASLPSTNVVSMPKSVRVFAKRLYVPPYMVFEDTI